MRSALHVNTFHKKNHRRAMYAPTSRLHSPLRQNDICAGKHVQTHRRSTHMQTNTQGTYESETVIPRVQSTAPRR